MVDERVYLSGQHTYNDSTIFGGWRFENRFRPLPTQHIVNPILYVEYEDVNLAEKSILEVTGHASIADFLLTNAQARQDVERSLELKLILSSNFKGWNVSENFIAEKASRRSLGIWRMLWATPSAGTGGQSQTLRLLPGKLRRRSRVYGGLGTTNSFGLEATSQYAGPAVAFNIPNGPSLTFGTDFGLNANSLGVIYRFNVSYEFQQAFRHLHHDQSGSP